MAELLDSAGFRAVAFAFAALAAALAWRRERALLGRSDAAARRVLCPVCWLVIGAAYASIGVAIGFDLAGTFGDAGRDLALSENWYDSRRPLQALVVAVLAISWVLLVTLGIWRVRERRGRYLASVVLCSTLVCFALVRVVSLHYVDAILSRTILIAVPLGTMIELVALVGAIILAFSASQRPISDQTNRVDSAVVDSVDEVGAGQ